MNFDFTEEQRGLQDELRNLLTDIAPPSRMRAVIDEGGAFDSQAWAGLASYGWLGMAVPESFGGAGLGSLEMVLAAEEVGRTLAAVPFSAAACAIPRWLAENGPEDQRQALLADYLAGSAIIVPAGLFDRAESLPVVSGDRVSGAVACVPDGAAATHFLLRHADGGLVLVDGSQDAVTRGSLHSVDPSRASVSIALDNAVAVPVGDAGAAHALTLALAVYTAFEELGGADATLALTLAFMKEREAFGRPIASFQALKHRMADVYTEIELARSNCWYAAWALSVGSDELEEAAASARVSVQSAYRLAAREAIQMHGGMGFTWESDCHLHYRRALHLRASMGGGDQWRERLARTLIAGTA